MCALILSRVGKSFIGKCFKLIDLPCFWAVVGVGRGNMENFLSFLVSLSVGNWTDVSLSSFL